MMGRFFSRRATLAAVIECSFLLALGAAAPAAHAAEVKVMSTVALTPTLGVLDCEVLAVEPNKTLSYTWNFAHEDAAYDLRSVVTFTLTPTRMGSL
jgi:uncharacterized protein YndB with AHSA1/START domain